MRYIMNVGGVSFNIETPFQINWKSEDKQFFSSDNTDSVPVLIEKVSKLSINQTEPIYQNSEMTVYGNSNIQKRYYHILSLEKKSICSVYNNGSITLQVTSGIIEIKNRIWDYLYLEKILLQHNGLILHSVYMEYNGNAICFTAPSGTGKTTQANHWVKQFNAVILNGDKSLLKKEKGKWMVYGYPFHGSAPECINKKNKLNTIVILRQGKINQIRELSDFEKIQILYSEITVNVWDTLSVIETLDLINDLVNQVRVVLFYCTKFEDSANVLHEFLFKGDS